MNAPIKPPECCPTCGSPLQDQVRWDVERRTFVAACGSARFTRTEASIFDALWRRRHSGGFATCEAFIASAFADDPDGGPEQPATLSVHLHKIRKRIEPLGFTVTKSSGQPRVGFRLITCEEAGRMSSNPRAWPKEHDEVLRTCIAQGLSASRASAVINARFRTSYTRNAVIGRKSRLGLVGDFRRPENEKPRKADGIASRTRAWRKPHVIKRKPKSAEVEAMPVLDLPALCCADVTPWNLSLLELKEGQCRYPYGERTPFTFCGHPAFGKTSYCGPHYALCAGNGTVSERIAHERPRRVA